MMIEGLKGTQKHCFIEKTMPWKGRGVFLESAIIKGEFVMEYAGDCISEREARKRELTYAQNNEGCYIVSFFFKGQRLAMDATRQYDTFSRLLNHSKCLNINLHPALVTDFESGIPRLAAYALQDNQRGEEITMDYGIGIMKKLQL